MECPHCPATKPEFEAVESFSYQPVLSDDWTTSQPAMNRHEMTCLDCGGIVMVDFRTQHITPIERASPQITDEVRKLMTDMQHMEATHVNAYQIQLAVDAGFDMTNVTTPVDLLSAILEQS